MTASLSLVALGDVAAGIALHDEAAATVLSDQVSPWAGALVYCGLIFTCRNAYDWERASEWTDAFTRWCERSSLERFPGTCRLHRADVLRFRGELGEAERELDDVCRRFVSGAQWLEGDAQRVLGNLKLAQGNSEAAEAAFRRCHECGWDPQPGLALLRVSQGRASEGVDGLQRALSEAGWASRQRRGLLLATLVEVALAAGEPETAREAMRALDASPQLWGALALEAAVSQARAELSLHEGDLSGALHALRAAVRLWARADSPQNLARARRRLAELFGSESGG